MNIKAVVFALALVLGFGAVAPAAFAAQSSSNTSLSQDDSNYNTP